MPEPKPPYKVPLRPGLSSTYSGLLSIPLFLDADFVTLRRVKEDVGIYCATPHTSFSPSPLCTLCVSPSLRHTRTWPPPPFTVGGINGKWDGRTDVGSGGAVVEWRAPSFPPFAAAARGGKEAAYFTGKGAGKLWKRGRESFKNFAVLVGWMCSIGGMKRRRRRERRRRRAFG